MNEFNNNNQIKMFNPLFNFNYQVYKAKCYVLKIINIL
jgi:hypothetical protein